MFVAIEEFAKDHQFTIQALTAVGTLLAVFAALLTAFMSHHATRTRLKATGAIYTVFHDTIPPDQRPHHFVISVVNVGNQPLRIPYSFFHWKLRFRRSTWMTSPQDSFPAQFLFRGMPLPQKQYPVVIAPRATETFYLSTLAGLEAAILEIKQQSGWMKSFSGLIITGVVFTEDGTQARVRLNDQIKEIWRK